MSCKHVGKLYFNMMNDPGSNTFTRMGIVLSDGTILYLGSGFVSDGVTANHNDGSMHFYIDDFMFVRSAASRENQSFVSRYRKAK